MEYVQAFIQDNHLKPGDQIPTETRLMERFSVSRATVRQAIQELVSEGIVEKRHGYGTFVAEPKVSIELSGFFSFYEEAAKESLESHTSMLECSELCPAPDKVRRRLGLSATDSVCFVQRMRYIDGDPVLLESTYLPKRIFGSLSQRDFDGRSLYDVCRDHGILHVSGKERVRPYLPNEQERTQLNLENGIPTSRFSRLLTDGATPIEYTVSILKSGKVALSTTIDQDL